MSVLQAEELVAYQLRTAYLSEIADGVGERLITLDESIVNSPSFKAAGWRSNPGLIKRTHSPPIPTAVASEYFRAPRSLGVTLEDDDGTGLFGGDGARDSEAGNDGIGGLGGGGFGRLSKLGGLGGAGSDAAAGSVMSGGGLGPGQRADRPMTAANKRRRRREQQQLDEEDDSSDLSDESDDDASSDQRAAVQQIKFAKMPIRHRSGSSPLQSSNLRRPPILGAETGTDGLTSFTANSSSTSLSQSRPPPPRRGSQSALQVVKERERRDTVTSSEVSSENEYDPANGGGGGGGSTGGGFPPTMGERERRAVEAAAARAAAATPARTDGRLAHRARARRAAAAASAAATAAAASSGGPAAPTSRLRSTSSSTNSSGTRLGGGGAKVLGAGGNVPPMPGLQRQVSDLLEEEREDDEEEEEEEEVVDEGEDGSDDDEESDASDISSTFAGSIDSASILRDNMLAESTPTTSNGPIVVGTPPRRFTRTATVRRSTQTTQTAQALGNMPLPPPRPMSMMRPVSVAPSRSLLTAALQARNATGGGAAKPFERFATLSGQGEPNPINVRIYVPFSTEPAKPFEVAIRPTLLEDQRAGSAERPVSVVDLIGLSLWRYQDEGRAPPLPANRMHVNWWTLRMVEEGGEVDDDFPPLDRTRPLASFTTANNNKGGLRFRSKSKVYDDFALMEATPAEFEANQEATPQETEADAPAAPAPAAEETDGDRTPRNATPAPGALPEKLRFGLDGGGGGGDIVPTTSAGRPMDQPRPNPILNTTYRHNERHADEPAWTGATHAVRGRKKLLRVHIHSADAAPGQMVTVEVTTDTYLEEVLDMVCKKRGLEKASHVLKLPGSGAMVLTDREVSSIGNVTDLDLFRRRFEGAGHSPGSAPGLSPGSGGGLGGLGGLGSSVATRRFRRAAGTTPGSLHPLAREALLRPPSDNVSDANYKRYVVWRRQGLKIMGSTERVLTIDGEYVHIMSVHGTGGGAGGSGAGGTGPGGGGGSGVGGGTGFGKITTVHFSNVIGCKVSRRHPTHFKLIVYKATESKRYDFEAKTADEAAEIVGELKKAMAPYNG